MPRLLASGSTGVLTLLCEIQSSYFTVTCRESLKSIECISATTDEDGLGASDIEQWNLSVGE